MGWRGEARRASVCVRRVLTLPARSDHVVFWCKHVPAPAGRPGASVTLRRN